MNCKKTSKKSTRSFYHQDPNDPKTYAGRKRPRVRLNGLGDDGLPMTPNRFNSHRILNIYFVWGFASVAIGVIISVLSFFQGGMLNPWSMISTGGSTINGIEVSLIFRLEALYAMISGALFFSISFLGFSWLYDKQPLSTPRNWLSINIAFALGWILFCILSLGFPEPLSIIAIILSILFIKFSSGVEQDKLNSNK